MIDIIQNRDSRGLANDFYGRVKEKIIERIGENKSFLNGYTVNSGVLLGDYLESNIEAIISSPIQDLKFVIDDLHGLFKKEYKNIGRTKTHTEFKNVINSIFFYENHNVWKAYETAIAIGMNTCPYCNRSYIKTVGTDDEKFVRADFDHFLAKSRYPYFRLSFYNLIPSCIICNRNAKGKKKTSLSRNLIPYGEGFGSKIRFTYLPKSYDELVGNGEPRIDFLFLGNDKFNNKAKNNIETFRLIDQYSIHYQELNELIQKRRIFSESYLKELQVNFPNLINSFEEAYQLAFGKEFDLVNDEKRPLSKFTRDIADELGLLKPE